MIPTAISSSSTIRARLRPARLLEMKHNRAAAPAWPVPRTDRTFPKSQSPEYRSGLRDTKRRPPNTYYDKRGAGIVKKLWYRVIRGGQGSRTLVAAKPLDIWQTSSSTQWQYPPKRIVHRVTFYGHLLTKRTVWSSIFEELYQFGKTRRRGGRPIQARFR